MIEVNLEGRKTLDSIHSSLEEERQVDEQMAYRIEKFIEYENKNWIINHRDDIVGEQGSENITAKDYLVANKLTELVHDVNLDDMDTFNTVSKNITAYYESLDKDNIIEFKNSILVGDKAVNCCSNLENYIINMDKSYADYLDERVDWFYENYTNYANKKEAEEEQEEIEEPNSVPIQTVEEEPEENFETENEEDFEEEEIEEPEERRQINTAGEWALELGNYIVKDKKLVLRK